MDLLATLQRSGGIEAIARHAGAPSGQVLEAVRALLPDLVAALRAHVAGNGGGRAGVGSMLAAVERHGDGALAVDVMQDAPIGRERGDAVLAEFIPSSGDRQALARASCQEEVLSAAVLPLTAMLVCGYLSALAAGSGDQGLDEVARALDIDPD